jgi:hypothetical protein
MGASCVCRQQGKGGTSIPRRIATKGADDHAFASGKSVEDREIFRGRHRRHRVIRIVVGLALGYAAWVTWPGTISIVSVLIGSIALVTGLAGWCPAYAMFRISTKKKVAA